MLRNFLTLSAGEIAARGMHALAFLVLARVLKPAGLGTFELATAITTYALIVVLQGFDTIAIREVSDVHLKRHRRPSDSTCRGRRLLRDARRGDHVHGQQFFRSYGRRAERDGNRCDYV